MLLFKTYWISKKVELKSINAVKKILKTTQNIKFYFLIKEICDNLHPFEVSIEPGLS